MLKSTAPPPTQLCPQHKMSFRLNELIYRWGANIDNDGGAVIRKSHFLLLLYATRPKWNQIHTPKRKKKLFVDATTAAAAAVATMLRARKHITFRSHRHCLWHKCALGVYLCASVLLFISSFSFFLFYFILFTFSPEEAEQWDGGEAVLFVHSH